MDDTYHLPTATPVVRILHLTDPHLFTESDGQLLGVNTAQSFQAVLEAVQQQDFAFDCVLATGDLIQDNHTAGYHRFAQMTKPLAKPVFWLAGNHDSPAAMPQILGEYSHIQPHKQLLLGSHWQVLLLDSQVFGVPHGALSVHQLEWLAQKLTAQPARHTLIALHHNLLPTHSAWLDQHSLRNLHDLEDTLRPFSNVKGILHGHIHQAVDAHWQGYRVLATPSTSIQFKPNCNAFTLDLCPQGWRELTLYPNGSIETTVHRLPHAFLPDFSSTGY